MQHLLHKCEKIRKTRLPVEKIDCSSSNAVLYVVVGPVPKWLKGNLEMLLAMQILIMMMMEFEKLSF